jgi:hypothetical protein
MTAVADALRWGADLFSLGATAVGLYIGYRAYQAYRRYESRSMQFLAIGLFMLTALAYTPAFVGSVLLRLGMLDPRFEVLVDFFAGALQFVGLAFIAYSLGARGDG